MTYAYPTQQQLDERLKKVEHDLQNLKRQADNISNGIGGDFGRLQKRVEAIEKKLGSEGH
jgi:archaellum component FlaC